MSYLILSVRCRRVLKLVRIVALKMFFGLFSPSTPPWKMATVPCTKHTSYFHACQCELCKQSSQWAFRTKRWRTTKLSSRNSGSNVTPGGTSTCGDSNSLRKCKVTVTAPKIGYLNSKTLYDFVNDYCVNWEPTRILGQVVCGVNDDDAGVKLLENGATLKLGV